MASITKQPNGRRVIQFVAKGGKRKSLRLGKMSQRHAEEIKVKVEALNAAAISGLPIDSETAAWVAKVGDALAVKLAGVGLIPRRASAVLGAFTKEYIDRRTDIKTRTRENLFVVRKRLVEFFGEDRAMASITPGDADAWLLWLKERYADGTVGRSVRRAQQFFRAAVRSRLITSNPFADLRAPSQVNEGRRHFISLQDAEKVLAACPDHEWRLIFALARFGGLRCPSEHLHLTWEDVDWERGRLRVRSPKTEHHRGKGERVIPLFPELRPHLEAAFDRAPEGAVHVIARYRDSRTNLRTQLHRIIRKAGLVPWEKLFVNLRSTRQTELSAEYPTHVVCAWLGNSALIAQKHYLQVTDDHYERAAGGAKAGAVAVQKPVQQPAAPARTVAPESTQDAQLLDVVRDAATSCETVPSGLIPPAGLEPACQDSRFQRAAGSGAAKSGAVPPDPDLQLLIELWGRLPDATRRDIMGRVRATQLPRE
jgi:integrase